MKTKFSRRLWDRWLAQRESDPADPQFKYLAQGIRRFRIALAKKEPQEIT